MLMGVVAFKDKKSGEEFSRVLSVLEKAYLNIDPGEFEALFFKEMNDVNSNLNQFFSTNWPLKDLHPAYLIGIAMCEKISDLEYQCIFDGTEGKNKKKCKNAIETCFKMCDASIDFSSKKDVDLFQGAGMEMLSDLLINGVEDKKSGNEILDYIEGIAGIKKKKK